MRRLVIDRFIAGFGICLLLGAFPRWALSEGETPVDFQRDIQPILARNCLACHNATEAESDLVLEKAASIHRGGDSGPAVVPGKPEESLLWLVAARQEEPIMPPEDNGVGAEPLSPAELDILARWIQEGAREETEETNDIPTIAWQSLPPAIQAIHSVAVSPTGRWAACGRANRIILYDLAAGEQVSELTDPHWPTEEGVGPPAAHRDFVQSLTFHPHEPRLVSGSYREVKLWSRLDETRQQSLSDPPGTTPYLQNVCTQAEWYVAAWKEEDRDHLAAWNLDTGERLWISDLPQPLKSLCFSPDGNSLAVVSKDGTISLWDAQQGATQQSHAWRSLPQWAIPLDDQEAVVVADGQDGLCKWSLAEDSTAEPALAHTFLEAEHGVEQYSHVGKILAAATDNGSIHVWDLEANADITQINTGGLITCLTTGKEGTRLAAGFDDGTLRLWELPSGKLLSERTGSFLLAHEISRQERLVRAAEQRTKARTEVVKETEQIVAKAQESLDELRKQLSDAEAVLQELREQAKTDQGQATEGEEPAKAKEEESKQAEEKAQQAGQAVARAEADLHRAEKRAKEATQAAQDAQGWEATVRKQWEDAEEDHNESISPIRALAFSREGHFLASGDDSSRIQIWNAQHGQPLDTFRRSSKPLTGLRFDEKGQLWSMNRAGEFSVRAIQPAWQWKQTIGNMATGEPFSDRVLALAYSPTGDYLATGGGVPSRGGEIHIWDASELSLVRTLPEPHSDSVFHLAFSPDGRALASGAADRYAKTFSVPEGALGRAFEGHTHHVLSVAWRWDGELLASGGADNQAKLWQVESGQQTRTLDGFGKQVSSVGFLEDRNQLLCASADGKIFVRDAENGKTLETVSSTPYFFHCAATTPDGRLVVAGSEDGVLRVWKVDDGTLLHEFAP